MKKKRVQRRGRAFRLFTCGLLAAQSCLPGSRVLADGHGGSVVAGTATISQDGSSLNVNSLTDRTIIDWQGFSIGAGETANFLQPSATSAVLNRVITPNNPSAIYGTLNSNGNVLLVNPSGIVVGPSGVINTNGFTASVLDIPNNEFLQGGALTFRGDSTASVINQGTISTGTGGAALIGGDVINEGTITSAGGSISLATGGSVTLADGSRFTHADMATIQSGISPYAGVIQNSGTIRATGAVESGGEVYLVNPGGRIMHDGTIAASRATTSGSGGGLVKVRATEGGTATIAGEIEASGQQGGQVTVEAEHVELAGAQVDVSGTHGGGTANIGGGRLGQDDAIANALTTTMDSASVILAGATEAGNGGSVIIWGTDEVNFHGTIDTLGGDNGFVEVSTHGIGVIDGTATTGHMLVDPGDVCISAGNTGGCSADATILGFGTITNILNNGGVFELNTNSFDNAGTGRVVFGSPSVPFTINNTSDTVGTFEIHAADTIDTNQVVIQNNGPNGTNFEWYAGSSETTSPVASADIILGPQQLDTGGGYAYFEAADDILISDPLITDGGDATFIANGGAGGAVITIGAEGNPDDDHIDTTDGNGNAGAVTFVTDTFVINPNAATRPDLNLNAVIDAAGIGGIVTFRPTTPGRAINLGTSQATSLSITAADIDRIAAEVLRFGDATSGNITISDALAPTQVTNLSLVTGGQIVDGNAAGADVTATGLALQAASSDGLETAITNLAFDVTGGVDVSNTGGLTIAAVDGVTTSSATNGSVNLTAASPVTIATDVSASGNVTATATESGAVDTDNVTVNAGVTVQSTGGDVTLQAGDDVDVGAGATLSANGTLTLTAGFGDTDNDGGLTIGSAAVLSGPTINLTAINDILMSEINASSSAVNVTSTAGAVSLVDTSGTYQFGALSVTGSSINLGATISSTGAQTYESPVVLTADTILSSTGSGDISFNSTLDGLFDLTVNTGGTTSFNSDIGETTRLGSLTTDAGGTTAFSASSASSNIMNINIDGTAFFGEDVALSGNNQTWNTFGTITFDGTFGGNVDVIMNPLQTMTFNGAVTTRGLQINNNGTVNINGGSIRMTNFGLRINNPVVLGADTVITIDSSSRDSRFTDTIDGGFSLTVNSPGIMAFRDTIGGTTALTGLFTDGGGTTVLEGGLLNLSGNTLTFNDAVTLGANTVINDAGAVSFNNTVDGAFDLVVDAGGNVTFGGAVGGATPVASLDVGSDGEIIVNAAITTANGNVTFDADVMAIAASINAGTGIVSLRPRTAGAAIDLGGNLGTGLVLTDADLDLITAGTLRIGSTTSGSISVSGAISPQNTSTLSLITGDAIVDANAAGADLQVTNLALQAVNGIGATDALDLGVGTVAAANSTSGGIRVLQLTGLGDLTVGTVDGLVGVSNQATTGPSQTQILTEASNLIINSDVFSTQSPLLLSAGGTNLLDNNATISTAAGFLIDMQSSRMALEGGTVTAGNNGRVRISPIFVGATVDLGSTSDAGSGLELSDAELDTITAGTLQIGAFGLGDITVTAQITPANVGTLDLRTSGAVVDGTPTEQTDLTVQNLSIRSGGVTGLDTAVNNLAFANTSGAFDLANTGALTITAVDGLTTSSNTGTTSSVASDTALTFAVDTSSTGNATFTAPTINVNTGVAVDASPGGTLAFNATTVNLDGNLSAVADGITGTATTVNVVGSTGGAEIQDAVDVAAAGATINVGDGTFAGGIVVDKAVTLLGDGFTGTTTVTVADGTAGMTVPASGVTIDGFLFIGDGTPVDATGVVVDVSGGVLTGILIGDADADNSGSRFTGLTTGLSVTDGGTGNAAVVEIGLGNVFDNNVDGLVFDGTGADIDGDSLSNTAFGAHTGNFVELINGAEFDATTGTPTVIDATLVDFNGLDISDPANALAVEQQIVHYLDTGDVGLLRLSTDGPIAAADSIQLAVNAAGLLGGPQTVVVGPGTFGGSVEVWVDDLTLIGQGATTIIDTDAVDPFANNGDVDNGFQVAAISATSGVADPSGVTIDSFAFDTATSTGTNIGIELGETGVSEAIGATVQNSSFNDLNNGIVAREISGTTTISGVTMTDIASRGILFRPILQNDDVIVIEDSDIASTGDAVRFASGLENIDITITGSTLTSSDNDGVHFASLLNNVRLLVGGASAADGNSIQGGNDGVDFTNTITGSDLVFAGNTLIQGVARDGLHFDTLVAANTTVSAVGNTVIRGGEHGLFFGERFLGSTLSVAGNTDILGDNGEAIQFVDEIDQSGVTIGTATVAVNGVDTAFGGNGNIIGATDGIQAEEIDRTTFLVSDNTLVQGTGVDSNGIRVTSIILRSSEISIVGNTTIQGTVSGINLQGPSNNSALTIAGNATIRGERLDGITIRGASNGSTIVIAQNEQILGNGFGGIFVVDDLTDTEVIIGQATVTVDGTATAFGGNGDIIGVVSGVTVDGITGGSVTVAGNDLIRGDFAFGIFAGDITADALFAVVGNTEIRGGDGAGVIDFDNGISIASADMSTIAIAGNDRIIGNGNVGIRVDGNLTDTDFTIGTASVLIDGVLTQFGGNGNIVGSTIGVEVQDIVGGSFAVTDNDLIQGISGTGIDFVGQISSDADIDVTDNTIGSLASRVGTDGIAFRGGIVDTATVEIGGTNQVFAAGRAIQVDDLQSPSTLSITGGTYNGTGGALLVDNTGVAGNTGRLNVGAANYVGGTNSTVFEVLTDAGNAGVDIAFSGAATFDGGVTGVRLSGNGIDILSNTLDSISFLSELTNYIELADGAEFAPGMPTIIDATNVSFGGVLGSAMTVDQLRALETRLIHYPDLLTVGVLNTNDLFVVNGESLQLAVNAAGLLVGPQTVTVEAGTFGGSVEVWVDDLTLQGQGATTILDADAVDPFANNGDVDNGFQVAAISALSGGGDVSGVTIDGFAFDTLATVGNNVGVELGEAGVSQASGATIQNNSFNDLASGIVVNNVTGTTTVSAATMTSIAAQGIDFRAALGADDTILIENNSIASQVDAVRFLSALTGARVTIMGNTLEGSGDGLEFSGAISGGSNVTIAGNQRIEGLGTFLDEDGLGDGIAFRGAISEAATNILIDDNALIQGFDRGINFASARSGGPATVTDASVTISRNGEIRGTDIDGILFNADLTGAKIVIGGTTAADGNGLIIGGDEGIDIENVNGGSFTIANNTRIEGENLNGIEFEGATSNGAEVAVVNNATMVGASNGVFFGADISNSAVTIAGNTTIQGLVVDGISIFGATGSTIVVAENANILGDGFDGIFVDGGLTDSEVIIGAATVAVNGVDTTFGANGNIIGAENGVNVGAITGGSLTILGNTLIEGQLGVFGAGIGVGGPISSNAIVAIVDNTEIRGNNTGIILGNVEDSAIAIAQNDLIVGTGTDAIVFGQPLTNSSVHIGPAMVTIDGVDTSFGGNGRIIGQDDGINVDEINGGSFTLAENSLVQGINGSGIEFDGSVSNLAALAAINNTEIRGGEEGVEFDATVVDSTVTIAGNESVVGEQSSGIQFNDLVTDSAVTIGGPTGDTANGIFGETAGIEVVVGLSGMQPFVSEGNTINVTGIGILLNNLDTSVPVELLRETINGGAVGVQVNQVAGTGINGQIMIDGVVVNGPGDTGLEFTNDNGSDSLAVTLNGGVTVNGGASAVDNGIVFDGLGLSLVGDTLADTIFVGQNGNYVELRNGALFEPGRPTLIDGTGVDWDGLDPTITAERAAIIAKIIDFLDDPTLGLIFPGGVGLDENLTYDRFTRYEDYFRTIGSLLGPNYGTINYPPADGQVAEELEDQAPEE